MINLWAERRLTLVAIAAGAVATWMFVERKLGFDSIPRSYGELQYMADAPHVSRIDRVAARTVEVSVSSKGDDERTPFEIEVADGLRRYRSAEDSEEAPIEVEFMRLGSGAAVTMPHASVPIASSLPYCIADFAYSIDRLSRETRRRAERILAEAGLVAADGTETAILKLASHLCQSLEPHRGIPTSRMRRLDGLEQFEEAMAGESEVFCANHAEIFALLATVAGIPTRLVDVGGKVGDVAIGAHVFNECYVSEVDAWVYVDLELRVVLPEDSGGRLLNGIDVLLTDIGARTDGIMAYELGVERPNRVRFEESAALVHAFIPASSTLTFLWASTNRFSPGPLIHRLFLRPQPSFSIMRSGLGALWRLGFTYFALAVGTLVIVTRLRRFSDSRRVRSD